MHGKSRRASERTDAHIRRTPCSRTPRILQRTPHTRVQSACAKPPCASRTIRIPPPHVTCRLNINRHAVRTVPKSHTSAQAGHAADTPRIAHPRRTRFLSSDIAPASDTPPRPPSAGMRIRNIDKKASLCYNTERADKSALARRSHNTDGIWCNGNTRDFDSRFAGSSPAIPAIKETSFVYQDKRGFFLLSGQNTGLIIEKSGFGAVDWLLRSPIFCFQLQKQSENAGVHIEFLCFASNY